MKPHVAYVVNTDFFFLSHRLVLARAVQEMDGRVTVLAPDTGRAAEIRSHGIDFVPLPISRSGSNPLRELAGIRFLRDTYRSLGVDLVHHVTAKPVIYGSIAARLAGVPAVNAVSGLGYGFIAKPPLHPLRFVMERLYRVALHSPAIVTIFQNEDDRGLFVRRRLVPPDRTVLIRGSGVDLDEFCPRPEPAPPPVVLFPARLLGDKGVREFVAAAESLRRRGTDARFVLVGRLDPGNPAAIAEEELTGWTAAGTVEWWGHADDMPATLAHAHVVVLPSYREGLPKVLLEAGALGRAVVTTDVPGCRDVVEDGVNGLLVPARESAPLADAIARLLADPERRRAMGARAREVVEERFSDRDVAWRTLAVYERLLGRRFHARREAAVVPVGHPG